jgi:hypothetical protein
MSSVSCLCENHDAADPLLAVTPRSLSHTLKKTNENTEKDPA